MQGQAFAAPASGDARTDVLAKLCSATGQDVLTGLRQILEGVADAPASERAWAKRVVQAYSMRDLHCADDGSTFLSAPDGVVNAATLASASLPPGLRAPLPSLRTRALLAQLDGALTLFVAPAPSERLAAVQTLERHGDGLPPGLLQRALKAEHDPQVAAGLRGLIVAAGLHSPDITARLAAIHGLGRDPTSQVVTTLSALQADRNYTATPGVA
jgi:urea transport system permease protein